LYNQAIWGLSLVLNIVCLMVFNATFNNISVTSWRSVLLLVEKIGGPLENQRPVASHGQTLSHNVVNPALIEIRTHNISGDRHWLHSQDFVVIIFLHTITGVYNLQNINKNMKVFICQFYVMRYMYMIKISLHSLQCSSIIYGSWPQRFMFLTNSSFINFHVFIDIL
jgi:hypothetical protein